MLTTNGPMTLEQFTQSTQLSGADIRLFERFLSNHPAEFTRHPDSTYWFTGQPRPIQRDFESISHALAYALSLSPGGASVEELTRFLCLSTVNTLKTIIRRNVSRELSRRTDLFQHVARGRYTLIENRPIEELMPLMTMMPTLMEQPVLQMQQQVYLPFNVPTPDQLIQREQPEGGEGGGGQQQGGGGDDDDFDPFSFFGNEFQFAFE
jgi:HAMP domain-containing protein